MTNPPSPEQIQQPTRQEIGEFNQMALPYAHIQDSRESSSHTGGQLLRARPQDEKQLFATLVHSFHPEGEFTGLTAAGDFDGLATYARTVAERAEGVLPLTVPRAFAVHALTSILTRMGRAVDTEYPHSQNGATYFLTHFAAQLAFRVPQRAVEEACDPDAFSRAIARRIGLIATRNDEHPEWLQQKMWILADRLLLRKHLTQVIAGEPLAQVEDIEELRQHNDTLVSELQRLKLFSIKSAVHEGANSFWSIHDLMDVRAEIAAGSAARMVHPETWPPNMVLWGIEHEQEGLARLHVVIDDASRPNYDRSLRLAFMDERGQLFGDMHGSVPLEPLYQKAGKSVNYQALRQFLIQEYFDLTVPLSVVAKADEGTKVLLGERNPNEARDRGAVFHDLLLPRIMVIRTFETPEALEELERAEQAAIPTGIRQRLHERPGFPRRLPRGHKVSDRARKLAAEAGVELEPGWTWSKQHKRGDPALGESISRVKKRPSAADGQANTVTPEAEE